MVFVNAHTLYGTAKVVNEYTTPGQAQRKAEDSPMRAVAQVGDDSFTVLRRRSWSMRQFLRR